MQVKKYLTAREVSKIIGRSESTLSKDRFYKRGIKYVKNGRQIVYDLVDVLAFMDARKIDPDKVVQ